MKRMIFSLSAVAVLACGCGSGVDEVKALLRQEHRTEPVSVKAQRVDYSDNVAATILVGSVEPSKSSVVTVQYPGTVSSIEVRKGQEVAAGTVIAQMDSRNVQSAYDAAKAVYDQASDALARAEQVYGSGSISEAKMMDVRTSYAKAEATFNSASKALEDCTIKAPYSGVIGEVLLHEGMSVQASAPVVRLLDVGGVEVHASVPENEYARYRQGLPVRIEVPAAGVTLDGVLAVKGIEASKASRAYDCTFKFRGGAASAGIMPGMLCKVHVTGLCGSAIVIPASAVMVDGEGRYVWCCNEGVARKRHVTVDGFSGKGVIVSSGLNPGDMLVVGGARKISDGMSGIRVQE